MQSLERERRRSPLAFFFLTFALAVPFWIYGAMSRHQLMPGLPMAALMFICPGLAALILLRRAQGLRGVRALLSRAIDYRGVTPKAWYAALLLLNPGIFALALIVMRMSGCSVPEVELRILPTLALSLVFFIGALAEELGWTGYAIDPLQQRWGALRGGLLLGMVWAAFHCIALVQAHRSFEWIAWWSLWTVSQRVIMVWIYNATRASVFAIVLLHASANVCWQAFPVRGSFFDPRITGLITTILAIFAIALWRPRRAVPGG